MPFMDGHWLRWPFKSEGHFGNVLEELVCYKVIIDTGESGGVPDILPPQKLRLSIIEYWVKIKENH